MRVLHEEISWKYRAAGGFWFEGWSSSGETAAAMVIHLNPLLRLLDFDANKVNLHLSHQSFKLCRTTSLTNPAASQPCRWVPFMAAAAAVFHRC